jgi:hypothetical protein
MVKRLVDWIADLECGIDLFTQDNYKVPPTDSWLEQAA